MNTYTVIAYLLTEGGHHVETVQAPDATTAAVQLRERLELEFNEFEVVAVAKGRVAFDLVDENKLALAPYSITSP